MKKPLTFEDLDVLARSCPARESFGPDTVYPFLAFDLTGSRAELGSWLKDLPCPIIGLGKGALAPVCDVVLTDKKTLGVMAKNIGQAPLAAMVLVQHLRASESLSLQEALTAESFAYGTVQIGPEFLKWLDGYGGQTLPLSDNLDLDVTAEGTTLNLTFNRPDTRNAIGTVMRDALCETLDMALASDHFSQITLTGTGATFSTGGAIEEFGEVPDPATAHWVRSLRLPAWRLARLQDRLHIHVNGAAIGAGAEIAAFGSHVTASTKAWFQLPELKYGLIPGAGGTASIPRRIGRQRTAYMALGMEKIRAKTALEWGLIDAIID